MNEKIYNIYLGNKYLKKTGTKKNYNNNTLLGNKNHINICMKRPNDERDSSIMLGCWLTRRRRNCRKEDSCHSRPYTNWLFQNTWRSIKKKRNIYKKMN